jgi:putative pyoverdin transport system ATP-binding/permease protein
MSMLAYLFRHSWRAMVAVTVGAIVAGLASTALVAVIGRALVGQNDRGWLGLTFVCACIVYIIAKSLSEVGLLKVTQKTVLRLRLLLSRNLLATPQRSLQRIGRDELMLIMTRDVDTFSFAFQTIPRGLSNIVIVIAGLAYIAWMSWIFCAIMVAVMVLCVGGYMIAEQTPLKYLAQAREQAKPLQQCVRDVIDGSRELQVNAERRDLFLNRVLYEEARKYFALFTRGMSLYTWFGNVGNVLFYSGLGVLLFVVPLFMSTQTAIVTQVALVMLYIVKPLGELIVLMPTARQAEISFRRIQQLSSRLGGQAHELLAPDPFGTASSRVEFRRVSHHYDAEGEGGFTLGPLSFTLEPGEILFVVGGNGSGKTTLAMLLLGLLEADSGDILLNGVPLTEANVDNYRQRFSVIFSDAHLFEHLPVVAAEPVKEAGERHLRGLKLPAHVTLASGRFSTLNLSAGQRKRLALVSSYLEDRPICVFDEWAADQDPEFKRIFYTQILPELKARGKTIVIITHDDAYFHRADRILALEDGHLRDTVPQLAAE